MRLSLRRPVELEAGLRPGVRFPVVRSGTPLEVAEVAWAFEGVGREAALTIPAVAACRNAIVGTIVQLPAYAYRGDERLDPGYLLTRPDPSTTWTSTIAGTVDDLLFHGRAYWRVLERDSEGFPRRARWTPHRDVTPETRSSGGSYAELLGYRIAGVDGVVAVDDVIRFDGQAPPVLETGARTLAAGLELEEAARRLASVELPAGVLKNEGTELGDEEAAELVASFEAMRREHGIAFVQGLEYQRESISAADLQLLEARHNVATEVSRLFSVPVAMIGASPSGNSSALLYSNLSQQLAILVSSACAPHLKVVESTLSDVVPRGQAVAFDVQSFLRGDPQAAADYAIALKDAGLIDVEEARSMLGIPSSSGTPSDLTPGRL
jgi:HK97 family phage portal protein